MREIRFRGMSLNGWVYGHYLVIEQGAAPAAPCIWDVHSNEGIPIDAKTRGQFTGEEDSESQAIYEGDIVHIYDEGPFSTVDMLDVVIFKNGCFTTEKHIYDFYTCGGDCLNVRGNIYENPELIGGDQ